MATVNRSFVSVMAITVAVFFSCSAGCFGSDSDPSNVKQINDRSDLSFCTQFEETNSLATPPKGGMAGFQFFTRQASLNVFDNILGYSIPVGPEINFRINYNYLEALDKGKKSTPNLGAGWTLNWVAYLDVDSMGNVTVTVPGGGSEHYPINKDKKDSLYKNNLVSHAHLIALPDAGYQRHLADGSIELYSLSDENGRHYLTEVRSPSGNAAKVGYDKNFRVESVADAVGQQSKIRYVSDIPSDLGFYKISEIEDPFGRKAKFGYDKSRSRLESTTDAIGLTSTFTYAEGSNQISKLNTPYGETEFLQYRPEGSPDGSLGLKIRYADGSQSVAEHWAGNRHATYQWNKLAMQLYPADPQNHVYDHCKVTKWLTRPNGEELSVKASVKEPLESELVYSYVGQTGKGFLGDVNLPASVSRRVSVKNEDGTTGSAIQSSSFQYNRFGHVTRLEDPLRRIVTFEYAPNGIDLLEVRQQTPRGSLLKARFVYDKNHHPVQIEDASGNKVHFEFNKFGELIKATDSSNNVIRYEFDDKGFLLAVTGPLGPKNVVAKYSYDRVGRVRTATDQDGRTTSLDYDAADRIIKKSYEDGSSELIRYDKLDPVSFQDRLGRTTKRVYDSQGRMIALVDPLARKSQYEWCLCGSLRKLIDPAGNTTEWHHDIQGRTLLKKYANGSEMHFEYEKSGHRLLSRIDALKQKTSYSYNVDDTVSTVSYYNTVNPTSDVKFSYFEDLAAIKTASNKFGTISYQYYPFADSKSAGLLQSVSNSGIPDSAINYDYDSLGRVTKVVIGRNNTISRSYDQLDRLLAEENSLGKFSFEYGEGANNLTKITYPNGVLAKFQYESKAAESRLKSIINSTPASIVSQYDYAYDKEGQISEWLEAVDGKPRFKCAFAYDAAGQLTDAVSQTSDPSQARSYHYEYDAASNLKLSKCNDKICKAAFNNVNELISLANGSSSEDAAKNPSRQMNYDANGNLLSDGEKSYKWDAENRLIRIEYKDGAATDFEYDALGRRSKIVDHDSKSSTVKYLIWSDNRICEERNEDGSVSKKIYLLGSLSDGKSIFFSRDHLGSTRMTTDGSGNVVSRLDYDPHGVKTIAQGTELPVIQYAGYYAHEPSGLNFTNYRSYDSTIGRWLSRDPLGEFGIAGLPGWSSSLAKDELKSLNLYAYVGNNAIKFIDPLGLQQQYNSNVGSNFGYGDHTGGAGYGGGTANAGQATNGFGGSTGSWSPNSDQMQSGGTVQGGTVMGANTYGNGVNGALADGGVRLNTPQQTQNQSTNVSPLLTRQWEAKWRAYNTSYKEWKDSPFAQFFHLPPPEAPSCPRPVYK
ncbi:MAG: hypothetical protein K2X77_08130 [Candidatus Obscuribacterales bacterium]|nr:hypothetical protein [Candidatus Obscuribacterales bacterium]